MHVNLLVTLHCLLVFLGFCMVSGCTPLSQVPPFPPPAAPIPDVLTLCDSDFTLHDSPFYSKDKVSNIQLIKWSFL